MKLLYFCLTGCVYCALASNGTDESNVSQTVLTNDPSNVTGDVVSLPIAMTTTTQFIDGATSPGTSTNSSNSSANCIPNVGSFENGSNLTSGCDDLNLTSLYVGVQKGTNEVPDFSSTCYAFIHDGHCNGGWVNPSTNQNSLENCKDECANRGVTVGYFAYNGEDCACYTESAGCPDDDKHPSYNAYEILRSTSHSTTSTTSTITSTMDGVRVVDNSNTSTSTTNSTLTTTSSATLFPTTSNSQNVVSVNLSKDTSLAVNSSLQNASENASLLKKAAFQDGFHDENDDSRDAVLKWTIAIGLVAMLACGSAAFVVSRRQQALYSDSCTEDVECGVNQDSALPIEEQVAWTDAQHIQEKYSGTVEDTDSVEGVDGCCSSNIVVDIEKCGGEVDECSSHIDRDIPDVEVECKKTSPHSSLSISNILLEAVSPLGAQDKGSAYEAVDFLREDPNNEVPGERSSSSRIVSATDIQASATNAADTQDWTQPADSMGAVPITSAAGVKVPALPLGGSDTQRWTAFSFASRWFPAACHCTKPSAEDVYQIPRTPSLLSTIRSSEQ